MDVRKGKSVSIVSFVGDNGDGVNSAIRQILRNANLIGTKEIVIDRFISLNLAKAQKGDIKNHKVGHILQINQNLKGIRRGSTWTIEACRADYIQATNEQVGMTQIPFDASDKFEIYEKSTIALSRGDKIRIIRNGFDVARKRLHSGDVFEVMSTPENGNLKIRNPLSKTVYTLSRTYGHLEYAYCITSHASREKNVDQVYIAQRASTFQATDLRQFCLATSRARDAIYIYTDDKMALLANIFQSCNAVT